MNHYYDSRVTVNKLIGKTIIEITGMSIGNDEIRFKCNDGTEYIMFHSDDCCESVTIEDIAGEVNDLIGSPIVQCEESTSDKNPEGITPEYQDSFTWTFYRIATAKGLVVLRWYGESNGYYSESVDFAQVIE